MIEQSQRRVPMPVAAAVVVLLLGTAIPAGEMLTSGPSSATGGLIALLLVLALAYGLWRGSGRARFWTTVFLTASVVYGVVTFTGVYATWLLQVVGDSVVVGLLLVPASSRQWFHDVVWTPRPDPGLR